MMQSTPFWAGRKTAGRDVQMARTPAGQEATQQNEKLLTTEHFLSEIGVSMAGGPRTFPPIDIEPTARGLAQWKQDSLPGGRSRSYNLLVLTPSQGPEADEVGFTIHGGFSLYFVQHTQARLLSPAAESTR